MNILEYIDDLMDQGYSEKDAYRCADVAFNNDWDTGDEHELYYEDDEDILIEAFEKYGYNIFTPIA